MKLFQEMKIHEAFDHALAGGQALHIFKAGGFPNAPVCFKKTKLWAHLFDYDVERLKATARRLGVRIIKVSRQGQVGQDPNLPYKRGQHIDLCGKPLERAIEECEKYPGGHK